MRIPNKNEVAVWIEDIPESSRRAANPMVLAGTHHLHLAYYIHKEPDPDWDGSTVRIVGETTDDLECCLISFIQPRQHSAYDWGDEFLEGHPLSKIGFEPFALYEIVNPSLAQDSENETRHFAFMFHDSTFECSAKDLVYSVITGSVSSIIRAAEREC